MNKNILITISAVLLLIGISACGNRSGKVEEILPINDDIAYISALQYIDSVLHEKFIADSLALNTESFECLSLNSESENLNKVIANFHKYKDEERLFEGLEECFGSFDMMFTDTLLIFNFEKGTVKKVQRKKEKDVGVNCFNYIMGFPTSKTIIGDFNGDGKKESLMVENYESLLNQYDSVELKSDSSFVYFAKEFDFNFVFSDKTIPKLKGWGCMDYTIKNEGDLDGDGGDEIGFLACKTAGSLQFYQVYTLKSNKWKRLIAAPLTLDMRSTGIIPVEKDPKQKGIILIRYDSDMGSYSSASYIIEESVKISELLKSMK